MASRIQAIQRDQSKGSPVSNQSNSQYRPNQSNNQSNSQSNNRPVQRNPTQTSQRNSSQQQYQTQQSIHSPYYIPSDSPQSRASPNALTSIDLNQALPHSVPLSSSVSNSGRVHFDPHNPMSDRQTIQHPLQTINQSMQPNDPQPPPVADWQDGERFDIDTTDESDYEEEEEAEVDDDDDYGSEDDSPRSGRVLTFADEHGDNLCHVLTYDPHAYQHTAPSDTSQLSKNFSSASSVNLDDVSEAALQAQLHAQKIAREREKRTQRNDAEAACQCSIQ